MILDTLDNAHLYLALSPNVARALTFLTSSEATRLEPQRPGAQNSLRHPIDGDNVYALVQRYRPQMRRDALWEAHRRYIDVQYVVEGAEIMGWAPLDSMIVREPYDPDRDFVVLKPRQGDEQMSGEFFTVKAGMFAIFFPSDAHMPGVALNEQPSCEVKKIVVKVRA